MTETHFPLVKLVGFISIDAFEIDARAVRHITEHNCTLA